MSVINQLRVMVVVLLSFASLNVLLVYVQIQGMASDSRVVNFTGIVRGATQRLVKKEIAGHPDDELIASLDSIINGLINGDEKLSLPRATERDFIAKMNEVKNEWIKLKKIIVETRKNIQLSEQMYRSSEDYFNLTNTAAFTAEKIAEENLKILKILQIVLFICNAILLGGIWMVARQTSNKLNRTISTLATSANEIATTIEQQERAINNQATAVKQTNTTMDELNTSSQKSAQQAEATNTDSTQVLKLAQSGIQTVEGTLASMSFLKDKAAAVQEQIRLLNQQIDRISHISNLVSNVANQTNMLALNASVEAVRAGENGKSFGIVANEIRNLADRSKKSALEINALIANIEKAINATVKLTIEGTQTVNEGMKRTQGTVQAFQGVSDAINNIVLNSQQISLSFKQQALAIQQVVDSMNALSQGAAQTASGIAETKVAIQNLNEAAQNLKDFV